MKNTINDSKILQIMNGPDCNDWSLIQVQFSITKFYTKKEEPLVVFLSSWTRLLFFGSIFFLCTLDHSVW